MISKPKNFTWKVLEKAFGDCPFPKFLSGMESIDELCDLLNLNYNTLLTQEDKVFVSTLLRPHQKVCMLCINFLILDWFHRNFVWHLVFLKNEENWCLPKVLNILILDYLYSNVSQTKCKDLVDKNANLVFPRSPATSNNEHREFWRFWDKKLHYIFRSAYRLIPWLGTLSVQDIYHEDLIIVMGAETAYAFSDILEAYGYRILSRRKLLESSFSPIELM